jgi:hypothetical protein
MTTKTAIELGIEKLTEELTSLQGTMSSKATELDSQYKELKSHFDGKSGNDAELKSKVEEHTQKYAELSTEYQTIKAAVDQIRRELEAPVFRARNEKELAEEDKKNAIELQRRAFVAKGGEEDKFQADSEKLVNLADYRGAAQKLVKFGGLKKRGEIYRENFTDAERKAFDAASLDTAFFSPEVLGLTVDCNVECASLLDLYGQVTVSRSKFMYPRVEDYGAIGSYHCDVDCDADLGPEGNIKYLHGKTNDFRGVFCFLKKVLEEANYDFLSFMLLSAQRSYRINRNRALITGDGDNEPLGWLTADCFPKKTTPGQTFNHVDFRRFISSAPVEYGPVVPVMHQNVFGYLASATDNSGRFIFGDGIMTFSPDDVRERIRISNCLPDPTEGNTKGSAENPFDAGDFILAAGNWDMAYSNVNKSPMTFEQYIGGSSKWCVKYQFGAEDGSFVKCCQAAQVLKVGSAA